MTVSYAKASGIQIMAADAVTLQNAIISSNQGGGIYMLASGGSLTVQGCTIAGNGSARIGGGIAVWASNGGPTVTVEDSKMFGNRAGSLGGGIAVIGVQNFLMQGCSVTGNASGNGGGVCISNAIPGGAVIRDCTISGNWADTGGGVYLNNVVGTALVENTTISTNFATSTSSNAGQGGGGISERSFQAGSNLVLKSTIVAGNVQTTGSTPRPDLAVDTSVATISADHCLIGVADTVTLASGSGENIIGSTAAPLDPMLGPVANNGGPTDSRLLLPGSPAIDRGSNPGGIAVDQAGNPRVNGFAPDIGAVEVASPDLPVAAAAPIANVNVAGGTSQSVVVTYQSSVPIAVGSLDGGDIMVTGPNGFSALASLINVDDPTDGTPRTATYSFTPDGGAWSGADNGTFFVSVQANQVGDTSGNYVPANMIGTFQVHITQSLTVTTLADSGPGSLRDAITRTNTATGTADTIGFDPSLFANGPGTILLQSALPTIADSLTIVGPALSNGSPVLTVRRDPTATSQFRIIDIAGVPDMTISLANFAVRGGNTTGLGGGIQDGGTGGPRPTLNLTHLVVTGNAADHGGGVYVGNGATASFVDCTIAGNFATIGGGLYVDSLANVSLADCTVLSNMSIPTNSTNGAGGGIYSGYETTLALTNCTLAQNTTSGGGGAVAIGSGTVTIAKSFVSQNSAGGGGGGISTSTGGTHLSLIDSTVSGNSTANSGGGLSLGSLSQYSSATILDSTISENTAASGGGISLAQLGATFLVQNSTIIANMATAISASAGVGGGGISLSSVSPAIGAMADILLQSSIVGGNISASGRPDIAAITAPNVTITADHSLIGVVNNGFTLSSGSTNNLTGTTAAPLDPKLGPLENNGGLTPTSAPLPGSPAIDAGSNFAGTTTDQAGNPRVQGTAADIGASNTRPEFRSQPAGRFPTPLLRRARRVPVHRHVLR